MKGHTMKRNVTISLAVVLLSWTFVQAAGPDKAESDGTAWLGITFTTVPKPLAAHLGLDDGAVMVQNVVKGSPADKAGLQQYDVIVTVEGKPAAAGDLPGAIADRDPGDRVKLEVIRKADKRKVTVTLGNQPTGKVEYKYEVADAGEWPVTSRILVHPGKFLRKGKDGWQFNGKHDLPEELKKLLRDLPEGMPGITIEPDKANLSLKFVLVKKDDDGQTVRVQQQDDGAIVVERSGVDEDGKARTTRKSYKNAAELRKNDEEAYKLYSKAHVNVRVPGAAGINVRARGAAGIGRAAPRVRVHRGEGEVRVDVDVRTEDKGRKVGEMTEAQFEEKIRQAVREALKEAAQAERDRPARKPRAPKVRD